MCARHEKEHFLSGWLRRSSSQVARAAPTAIEKQDVAAPAVKAAEETPAASRACSRSATCCWKGRSSQRSGSNGAVTGPLGFISLIQRYRRDGGFGRGGLHPSDQREGCVPGGEPPGPSPDDKVKAEKARRCKENDGLRKAVRSLTERAPDGDNSGLRRKTNSLTGYSAAEGPGDRARKTGAGCSLIRGFSRPQHPDFL